MELNLILNVRHSFNIIICLFLKNKIPFLFGFIKHWYYLISFEDDYILIIYPFHHVPVKNSSNHL